MSLSPPFSLPSNRGRRRRRCWVGDGKAHIEVKTARREGSEELHERLRRELERLEGVHWAEVNAIAGRVVVAFDGESTDPADLVDVIEAVEEAHGVEGERFSHDATEHPGDGETIRRAVFALGADALAVGVSFAGVLLRSTPIPIEVGSVASFVDEQPRVRRFVENAVGPTVADLGLALGNATGMALSQGPLGLLVDALYRVNLLTAARAHAHVWEAHEPELFDTPDRSATTPVPRPARPVARPLGPVETYQERASAASLLGGAITLAATRAPRRAATIMLAGMARPTRMGRDAFVAQLGRALATRDVVVVDGRSLRRLDGVDTVVVDQDLLVNGRVRPDSVRCLADVDRADLHRRVRRLFRPDQPDAVQRDKGWSLGPVTRLGCVLSDEHAALIAELGTSRPLGVCHDGELLAVFDTAPETAPGAHQLVDAARQAGHMVAVAGDDLDLVSRLHADLLVDGGPHLADAVRMLQEDGCTVLLVSGAAAEALIAADVALGVVTDHAVPWGADVFCHRLDQARGLVDASDLARDVARQGNAIALAASSVAAMLALNSPIRVAAARVTTTINAATLLAVANGTRAAVAWDRRPAPGQDAPPRWHELSRPEVLRTLDTSLAGLTQEQEDARRHAMQRPLPAPVALLRAIGSELANPFTPVLVGGALLSATVGSAADAGIVLAALGLNGVISGVQRFAGEQAVRALVDTAAINTHVRRDGDTVKLTGDRLVPGDIVVLGAGETVPADCRVLQVNALEVDESSLTGESEPVAKTARAVFGTLVSERSCMLYQGTTAVAGSTVAVVVATDDDTEAAAKDEVGGPPPVAVGVEQRLRELAAVSLPVAGASGAAMATSQLLWGRPLREALASAVSLTVAAVPEGLPMLATVGQLAAARRLSRLGVLVRNPRAIEALGRAEVLCIDKTGTLTVGRVEVRLVSDGRRSIDRGELGDHERLVLAAARRASPGADAERSLPHYTDRAVSRASGRAQVDDDLGAQGWERFTELPFGPDRPYHATWGTVGDGARLSIKGAPEFVIERSQRWRHADGEVGLDDDVRAALGAHVDHLARQGLRLLAVAERDLERTVAPPTDPSDEDIDELVILGFVALADPIRETATSAIEGLRAAGVDIVMVTGDHPSTAEGIAAELGILDGRGVVTGTQLEAMSDAELDRVLPATSVFARVTPRQKVRIVAAFQRTGRPVAMTGDGANDANAMRLADAGIAVGAHCAPAARTAADVIITDNRIETIVETIIEGRALWAAVRDALAILVGGNLGEIAFILLSGGLGRHPSLSTRQILLVNLLTDIAPSLAIAARPPANRTPEQLAQEGPDRSLGAPLNQAILQRAAVTTLGATTAWTVASLTGRPKRAGTVGLVALVGTQLGQTLVMGRGDPVVSAAAVGSAALLAAVVETPGLSQFFGCTPLGPIGWTTAVTASAGATMAARFAPAVIDRVTVLGRELRAPAAAVGDGARQVAHALGEAPRLLGLGDPDRLDA